MTTRRQSKGAIRSDGMRDKTARRLTGRRLQATRLRIWSRDPYCAMCRKLVEYPSGFELDHKTPLFKGGSDEDSNLQALCIACHERKTASDMQFQPKARFDDRGRVVWDRE